MPRRGRHDHDKRDTPLQLRTRKRVGGKISATSSSDDLSNSNDRDNEGPKFEFLTTTGPPSERSKESRYVVRSHAMQAFLHEKNSDSKSRPKVDTELEDKNIGDLKGRFKLTTWSRKGKKKGKQTTETQPKVSKVLSDAISSERNSWSIERAQFTVR
jgi:hypothetical protein